MVVPAGKCRLGEIPADNLSYASGVKATVVCFSGGKALTRHNLGAASLSLLVPTQTDAGTRARTTMTLRLSNWADRNLGTLRLSQPE
jgi:hypothetical protein